MRTKSSENTYEKQINIKKSNFPQSKQNNTKNKTKPKKKYHVINGLSSILLQRRWQQGWLY